MSHDVEVRSYQPGDETEIIRLFKEIFGREMSLEEWLWKYKRRGRDAVYASIAESGNHKILGHYGAVPLRMYHGGEEIRGAFIGDVMIHPKFRGMKNLKTLTHKIECILFESGFLMVYGFPNEKTLMAPAERMGLFERVEQVFEARKGVSLHNSTNRLLYRLFPLGFEDDRIDDLWDNAKKDLNLAVIRDRRYFRWRYREHPLFPYELWGLRKRAGFQLLALAAIRRTADRLMIMDAVFRKGFLIPLLEKIENLAAVSGVKTMNLWLPQEYHPILIRTGFAIHPTGTTIPCTTHSGFLKKEDIRGKFFFTMGDTDFL